MKALFIIAKRVGDGLSVETAFRPWFQGAVGVVGHSAIDAGDFFAGNVFAQDQTVLGAIAADPRTVANFPIDIAGSAMAYDEAFEVPPATRGKIIAWAAQQWGAEFGQEVAANAKSRQHVAEKIIQKASGVSGADPLNGWRVYWT